MSRVLRLPLHDDEASFVLLNVDTSRSTESRPLDLTLVGTENEAVYALVVKQQKVSTFRSKNSPCSTEEWVTILESILLGRANDDSQHELLAGVEAVASIDSQKTIDVTVRKRVEGITQRLGSFQLQQEEREVDLFEWCGHAVQSTTDAQNDIQMLTKRFKEQQEMVTKLNAQLEELIAAKTKHEEELLFKFSQLLNEKKAKIRDQQRLLAAAKVDPAGLVELGEPGSKQRGGKRKAAVNEEDDDESDDAFDTMDVDKKQQADAIDDDDNNDDDSVAEEERLQTPDPDEGDETVSEDDVDPPSSPPAKPPAKPPARRTRNKPATKAQKSKATNSRRSTRKTASPPPAEDEDEESKTPPPRRELPFAKKKAAPASQAKSKEKQPVVDAADDETASEDEL